MHTNRRVRLDLLILALFLAVLLACAYVAWGSTQTQPAPVQQPTPAAAEMQSCPYCHRIYPGVTGRDGVFRFTGHPYIRMPVSETKSFETCVIGYRDHMFDCFVEMAKVGAGQIVDTKSGGAKP
jgi:hypothetical protein